MSATWTLLVTCSFLCLVTFGPTNAQRSDFKGSANYKLALLRPPLSFLAKPPTLFSRLSGDWEKSRQLWLEQFIQSVERLRAIIDKKRKKLSTSSSTAKAGSLPLLTSPASSVQGIKHAVCQKLNSLFTEATARLEKVRARRQILIQLFRKQQMMQRGISPDARQMGSSTVAGGFPNEKSANSKVPNKYSILQQRLSEIGKPFKQSHLIQRLETLRGRINSFLRGQMRLENNRNGKLAN